MSDFTLVSTVFNEGERLSSTLADLESQTLRPSQIVITDAGSTDGTYEELVSWAKKSSVEVIILKRPKCNVAEGRNLAIRNAKFNLIVSTDFGCRFHRQWLESIVTPFENSNVKVVGGAFTVDESSVITVASRANYILTNGYELSLDDGFIPSSRSIAYYKSVWESVGGYCQWLTLAADDLVFGKALKAKGYVIEVVDEPYVYWGRHSSVKGYARESFRYGLGDGEARVNLRNTISNFAETSIRYLLFACVTLLVVNLFVSFADVRYFAVGIAFLPGLRSYFFALRNWRRVRSSKYHFFIFLYSLLMIEATRFNYLKGYLKGYFFSDKHVREQAATLAKALQ